MNCEQFQNLLMEDPSRGEREFLEHRDHCTPCAREWRQAQEFEAILRAAVSVQPEKELEAGKAIQRSTGWWHQTWVSRAASVLLLIAVSIAGFNLVQQLFSAENLPQLVVRHIQKEPKMLGRQRSLGEMELMKVLTPMKFSLVAIPGDITAAAPCWIRKGRGMHLVVQGIHGPVTMSPRCCIPCSAMCAGRECLLRRPFDRLCLRRLQVAEKTGVFVPPTDLT